MSLGKPNSGNGSERRRVLVVGLDAATWDLVLPWVEAGMLPTMQRLIREGVRAPLRSTLPALTPPGLDVRRDRAESRASTTSSTSTAAGPAACSPRR